jgi:lantibiotic modifying enzyme
VSKETVRSRSFFSYIARSPGETFPVSVGVNRISVGVSDVAVTQRVASMLRNGAKDAMFVGRYFVRMTRIISLIAVAFVASSELSVHAQDSQPGDPIRASVKGAVDWIARQAVPVKDEPGAILFRENADTGGRPEARVYGGTAGVLIFLENAAHVLKDDRARKLADETARGLVVTRRMLEKVGPTWSGKGATGAASLYVGDAGIGHAFLVRARLRKDKAALATAVQIADGIVARGTREGDTLRWPDGQTDIIYGSAGTVLFLVELAAESGEKRFAEAAAAAGRWLAAQAVTSRVATDSRPRRLSWPMGGRNRHMPNFSHGTAGIAYALARVGAATGDATCTEAAKDGAAWLIDHAIHEGDGLTWPAVEGSSTKMGGWCHGPPGTARLFLFLHRHTGEQRYLDVALSSARWVIGYADAATAKKAALPPSLCCGVAGALDFFCDLYRATGKQEFADFARRAGEYLVGAGVRDGDGLKWRNGASAHGGREQEFGIDLMLGASGEALALLRLATLHEKQDPVSHLPDRAIGTP